MKESKTAYIRLEFILLIIAFGLHGLIAFLLSPLYSIFAADVTIPIIISDLIRGLIDIFDIAVMSLSFCILAASFFMYDNKKVVFSAIYLGAVLFRRLAALLTTLIINRSVSTDELFMSASVLILDCILFAIAFCVCLAFAKKYKRSSALLHKGSVLFNEKAINANLPLVYPFKKIYDRKNPLQSCLLVIGIILSAVKIISRTFGLIIEGTPNVFMTVASYACDMLIIVIAYALSCWLLSVLYSANEKRKALEDVYK